MWNLDECIWLLGQKTHHELFDILSGNCLGVSSLGFHRLGLVNASPFRAGYYTKSGIPFIYYAIDSRFPGDFLFR